VFPLDSGRPSVQADLLPVAVDSLTQLQNGMPVGDMAFDLEVRSAATGQPAQLVAPLMLTYRVTAHELSQTNQPDGIRLALWTGQNWIALPCGGDGTVVSCTTTHTGLIAVLLPHAGVSPIEDLLANGKGYTITDGFNGGSFGSFVVADDD